MIRHLGTLTDCLYFRSKNANNIPTKNSFDNYYMPLVEIKDFNALNNNKPFFVQSVKQKQKGYENLFKCQEMVIIQQEIY